MKKETTLVCNALSIYESMIRLESVYGKHIPYLVLREHVQKKALYNSENISDTSFTKVFWKLMCSGTIFIPREGYVQRVVTLDKSIIKYNK